MYNYNKVNQKKSVYRYKWLYNNNDWTLIKIMKIYVKQK